MVDHKPDPTLDLPSRISPIVMHEDDANDRARPGVRVSVDSGDQTINLILSYGSAAVACFALMVVVGLAYVMGRHSARGPLPLLADRTTEEVRKDKPRGDVLDLGSGSGESVITPAVKAAQSAKPSPKKQDWNDARPPATLVTNDDDKPRQVGLNYVIIQSYPDLKDAEAAKALLWKHGIKTTIEPPPAGWSVNNTVKIYTVIGKTGFDHIRNSPEYDRYCEQIMKLSDEFAGNTKYKRFQPSGYKWKDPKRD